MTGSYNPTAVVFRHRNGEFDYDMYPTLAVAHRNGDRYRSDPQVARYWVCPTVHVKDLRPGDVILDTHGEVFRVRELLPVAGRVSVRGQVWECGNLRAWCVGIPAHQFIAEPLAVFPVMPDLRVPESEGRPPTTAATA